MKSRPKCTILQSPDGGVCACGRRHGDDPFAPPKAVLGNSKRRTDYWLLIESLTCAALLLALSVGNAQVHKDWTIMRVIKDAFLSTGAIYLVSFVWGSLVPAVHRRKTRYIVFFMMGFTAAGLKLEYGWP